MENPIHYFPPEATMMLRSQLVIGFTSFAFLALAALTPAQQETFDRLVAERRRLLLRPAAPPPR